jgi:hypothetical protein
MALQSENNALKIVGGRCNCLGLEPRVDLATGWRCAIGLSGLAVQRLDIVAQEAQCQRGRLV